MESEHLLYSSNLGWTPILIIFGVITLLCIAVYRIWINKYKKIPDKAVIAKLKKDRIIMAMAVRKVILTLAWPMRLPNMNISLVKNAIPSNISVQVRFLIR